VPEMLGEMVESGAPSGCRACAVCSPCTCQMLGHIVLPSTLALSFHIALVFLRVTTALLQGAYSHTGKHMRGQRMRQKIAFREGRSSSVFAPRPLAGAPCFRKIRRIAWCAQVSCQCLRHRSGCEVCKVVSVTRQCHSRPSSVLASAAGTTNVESCDKQVGTRAPGPEPGRLGSSRSTLTNRVHAATVLGERSNN